MRLRVCLVVLLMTYFNPSRLVSSFPDHEERIPWFTNASQSDPELPYGPLLRCGDQAHTPEVELTSGRILDSQDDFVQLKATQILTVLLRLVEVYTDRTRT